jgi:nucleotide-binding universal stress UspA family protein
MRRILACVDLSESSQAVIACACGLASPGGKVVLLHVAAGEPEFVGYRSGPDVVRDAVARELREEHLAVQRLADGVRDRGLDVTPLTVQGATAERILEHAERLHADFIIVASRGHGVLHDVLVGSTVRAVLHAATVPVVVVPWR